MVLKIRLVFRKWQVTQENPVATSSQLEKPASAYTVHVANSNYIRWWKNQGQNSSLFFFLTSQQIWQMEENLWLITDRPIASLFRSPFKTSCTLRCLGDSVECPISAQVTILWFVSSSPASGSVLTVQSLEPASDSVSPSLPAPLPLARAGLGTGDTKAN